MKISQSTETLDVFDAEEITNLFLWGEREVPHDLYDRVKTEAYVNSLDVLNNGQSVVTLTIDGPSYMESGAGRFIKPSQWIIVRDFFETPGLEAGEYTFHQAAGEILDKWPPEFPTNDYFDNLSITQTSRFDGNDLTSERAYIFQTSSFTMNRSDAGDAELRFVVTDTGERYIENLQIRPFDDNFDFNSTTPSSIIFEYFFGEEIDPYGIGHRLEFDYTNTDIEIIDRYTYADFLSDESYVNSTSVSIGGLITGSEGYSATMDAIRAAADYTVDEFALLIGDHHAQDFSPSDAGGFDVVSTMPVLVLLGEGDDEAIGGDLSDRIYGHENNDRLEGAGGNDTLVGGSADDQLKGGHGDDVLFGDNSGENYNGAEEPDDQLVAGNDHISGDSGDDMIDGGAGNDDLTGGAGVDRLYGGEGDDVLSDVGDVDGDALFGGSGNDELTVEGTGAALLSGGSGNDILRGNGNSELFSGSGADVIYAMTGDKIMDRTTAEDRLFVDDVEIAGNLPTLTPQSFEPGEGENFFWGQKAGSGSFWVYDNLEKPIPEYDFAVFFEINDDQSDFDGTFQSVSYTIYIVENPGAKGIVLTDVPNSSHSAISAETIRNNSVIIEDFRPGDFGLMEKLQQEDYEGEVGSSFIAGNNFFYDSPFDDRFNSGILEAIQVQGETVYSFETEIGAPLPHTEEYLREEALRERLIETQPELLVGQVTEVGDGLGSAADDLLVGDGQSGLFETLGGLDLVFAGGGDDTVDTGNGADFVVAGAGTDVISGGEGADVLYGDFVSLKLMPASLAPYFDGTIDGPAPIGGSDTITGGAGDDVIYGGTGSDLLHGDSGNDQIFGEEHDDSIFGGEGADTISGGAGDDVIDGGHGRDVISGGEGADSISGDEGGDMLNGGAGNDIIGGGDGNDDLAGDDGHDTVLGGAGQDTIDGGRGDDELTGGLGDDELFGGVGDDLYIYALGDGNDRILDDGPFAFRDTDRLILADIASTDVSYTNVNDNLLIELPDGASITIVGQFDFGNAGIEEIEFSDGVVILVDDLDPQIVLQGTNNDDTIEGDRFNEILQGLDGNDLLLGNDGRDTLDGGAGDDSLDGSDGNDVLSGGTGNDTLQGGSGSDVYSGGAGDDLLLGNGGADSFDGGEGNDTLDFSYSSNDFAIDLTASTATFTSGTVEAVLGIENIVGGIGSNDLKGSAVANAISGGAGADTVEGLVGDDTLEGGSGADLLFGGVGADRFVMRTGDGADTIADFDITADIVEIAGDMLDPTSPLLGVTLEQVGQDVLISHGMGDTILLQNVSLSQWQTEESGLPPGPDLLGTSGNDRMDHRFTDVNGNGLVDTGQRIFGDGGADRIYDGAGDDIIYGGAGRDTFFAGAGSDLFFGGLDGANVNYSRSTSGLTIDMTNADNSTGDAFGDQFVDIIDMNGSGFDDIIYLSDGVRGFGGDGNDIIYDAGGTETLYGQGGSDIFVFLAGDGERDRVSFFEEGSDLIDLSAWGVTSFSELTLEDHNIKPSGSRHIDITFGDEELRIVSLSEADASNIGSEDFIFAVV